MRFSNISTLIYWVGSSSDSGWLGRVIHIRLCSVAQRQLTSKSNFHLSELPQHSRKTNTPRHLQDASVAPSWSKIHCSIRVYTRSRVRPSRQIAGIISMDLHPSRRHSFILSHPYYYAVPFLSSRHSPMHSSSVGRLAADHQVHRGEEVLLGAGDEAIRALG